MLSILIQSDWFCPHVNTSCPLKTFRVFKYCPWIKVPPTCQLQPCGSRSALIDYTLHKRLSSFCTQFTAAAVRRCLLEAGTRLSLSDMTKPVS